MANTEDSGDSLDGLIILELVVLKITNEKWADRIHFVQFNSEYGAKENIIKNRKENLKMKKKLRLILLTVMCLCLIGGVAGCAVLDDAINEIKGNLVGNGYTIRTYDNYGSKVMTTTGGILEDS